MNMGRSNEEMNVFVNSCSGNDLEYLEQIIKNRKKQIRLEEERVYKREVQKNGYLVYTEDELKTMCWETFELEIKKYYDQKLSKMLEMRKVSYLKDEKSKKDSTEDYFYLVSYENNEGIICHVKINIVNIPFS